MDLFLERPRVGVLATAVVLIVLAGCATLSQDGVPPPESKKDTPTITADRAGPEGIELFPKDLKEARTVADWQKWIIHPIKRKTDYRWRQDKDGPYLAANSIGSASGLVKKLDLDPQEFPRLGFSWFVENSLEGADVAEREGEDSPVRIVLAFDGDTKSLPVKERLFFERVKLLSGQELPYATLMYVWDNKRPVGSIVTNPHTSRIRKVVASSGDEGLNKWQIIRRNLVEDFQAAYGMPPGRLIGIALLSDTDNTQTKTKAKYRGLRLLQKTAGVSASR